MTYICIYHVKLWESGVWNESGESLLVVRRIRRRKRGREELQRGGGGEEGGRPSFLPSCLWNTWNLSLISTAGRDKTENQNPAVHLSGISRSYRLGWREISSYSELRCACRRSQSMGGATAPHRLPANQYFRSSCRPPTLR